MRVSFDSSIITDTVADKAQVLAGLMGTWEHRSKRYSEDKTTAKRRSKEFVSRSIKLG